jgi:hypothetical protein
MAAKRKKKEPEVQIESGFDVVIPDFENDETYGALKDRYFKLIKKENMPHTKEITSRLDNLEKAIRQCKAQILAN